MKAECLLRLGQADEAAKVVTEVRARNFKGDFAIGGTKDKATVTGADLQKGSCYDYGVGITEWHTPTKVAMTFNMAACWTNWMEILPGSSPPSGYDPF